MKGKYPKYMNQHSLSIRQAENPSDIRWENQHVGFWNRFLRKFVVVLLVVVILLVTFHIIYLMKVVVDSVDASSSCHKYEDMT